MRHPEPGRLADLDALPREERLSVLAHAKVCPACRAALLAADPSRVFAFLGLDAPPEVALDRLSERIDAAIAAPGTRSVAWRRVASLAASLFLAALLGSYLLIAPVGGPERAATRRTVAPEPGSLHDPVRGLELISSPGSGRVVNLSVGETRVVMIFDEEMDI